MLGAGNSGSRLAPGRGPEGAFALRHPVAPARCSAPTAALTRAATSEALGVHGSRIVQPAPDQPPAFSRVTTSSYGGWKVSQPAGKPNSVPPSLAARLAARTSYGGDDHSSRPVIAHGLQRPTRWHRTGRSIDASAEANASAATLFGLAPCGVLPATDVTAGAVRSYRTFSPLPFDSRRPLGQRSLRAVYFLCHWSVRLPCPGVTRRLALRSSDFPLPPALRARETALRGFRKQRSSGRLRQVNYRVHAGAEFPAHVPTRRLPA